MTHLRPIPFAVGALVILAAAAAAQERKGVSEIAGVLLPSQATVWPDADGSRAATVGMAASLVGGQCGAREFFLFSAASGASRTETRVRLEQALQARGWRTEPISRTDEDQRFVAASRAGEKIMVAWQPDNAGLGLLICAIEPVTDNGGGADATTVLAQADPSRRDVRAFDGTPLPVPRPQRPADAARGPASAAPPAALPAPPATAAPPVATAPPGAAVPSVVRPPAVPPPPVPARPAIPGATIESTIERAARDLPAAPVATPAPAPGPARPAAPVPPSATVGRTETGFGGLLLAVLGWLLVAGAATAGAGLIWLADRRRKAEAPADGIIWLPAVATVLSSGIDTEVEAALPAAAVPAEAAEAEAAGAEGDPSGGAVPAETGAEPVEPPGVAAVPAEPVTWYAPAVRYEYQVAGATYVGSRIAVEDSWYRERAAAEAIAARYQPPAGIEISYDQTDPTRSLIERSVPQPSYLLPGGIAALVLAAALALTLVL